jgi:hypothetical protein
MRVDEIPGIVAYLSKLYPTKFVGMNPAMAEVWAEALERFPMKTVYQAIKRWASQNQSTWAPSAKALADTAELILVDEEASAEQARRVRARGAEGVSYAALVEQAAHQQADPTAVAWASGHATMLRAVLEDPQLNTQDKKYAAYADWCERFAAQHPEDADDWRAEAAWWRSGAHGKPSLGTRRTPMMSPPKGVAPYRGKQAAAQDTDGTYPDIPF